MGRFDRRLTLEVEEGKFLEAQIEGDLFRFAWSKSDAAKSLEASYRLFDACPQVAHVALNVCVRPNTRLTGAGVVG